MAKDRDAIYQAVQAIPEAMHTAQRYLKLYGDWQAYELQEKTAKLFSAVLVALTQIISYIGSQSGSMTHTLTGFVLLTQANSPSQIRQSHVQG